MKKQLFCKYLPGIVCATMILAACQAIMPEATPTQPAPTASATATTAPPRRLTICMGEEPRTLYLYGGGGLAMRTVLDAVYDGPMDALNFSYSPVILEQVPSLQNGGAEIRQVTAQAGDWIISENGTRAALIPGVRYRPAGCTDSSCVAVYTEGEVVLDQMVVTFQMITGLAWSDGNPLTSDDSVYSYELASSKETPIPAGMKRALEGTLAYEALDEYTLQWTGLPGNLDPAFGQRFWTPLPRHVWGSIAPAALLTADESSRKPIGWGPYVIESWEPGRSIEFSRNSYYARAKEGLPNFDRLSIRFIDPSGDLGISALLTGECDILDQTVRLDDQIPMLLNLTERNLVQAVFVTGTSWEHLDFNLKPAAGYGKTYLQDKRLRQAMAMCIDRQKIVDETLGGLSVVPDSYLPPQHPLHAKDAKTYAFDPEAGKALLEQIGWRDLDSDPTTPRVSAGIPGIKDGTELRIRLDMIETVLRREALMIMADGIGACQIGVEAVMGDNSLFLSSQDGRIFGLRYDMAQFSWLSGIEPACDLYTTGEIPSINNGWLGMNVTGFSDAEYDQVCDAARHALPGTAAYIENHKRAQQIFAENLPSIPLYLTVKTVAARPDLIGLILDSTVSSALWNLEVFDFPEP